MTAYREQRRGGIGVMGMDLKDGDYIEHLFVASTHDYLLFFTSVGKVYRLKVHELPLGSRQSKGRAIVNLLPFRQDEQVRAVVQTRNFEEAKYLFFATKNGIVKKTEFGAYNTPLRADGIIAIKMREGDELVGVRHSSGDDDVLLVSRKGQAIRFAEQDVRSMGRDTSGVQGMRLRRGDEVICRCHRRGRRRPPRGHRERLRQAHAGRGLSPQGSWRHRREDRPADGGKGTARRRPHGARGNARDDDLHRGHGDPDGGEEIKRLGRSTQGVIVMRLRGDEQVSTLALRCGRGRAERGRGRSPRDCLGRRRGRQHERRGAQTSSTPTSSRT